MSTRRNEDAQGRSDNTFTNPIGSVPDMNTGGSSTFREADSNSQQYYGARGEGGKMRHAGYFSSSNPYLNQLKSATNNQDIDALYELAVQWEADYANRQMQLEENRNILEEQRQYDSPREQVSRMRSAGINPDLEGAGSGGSVSGGSGAQLNNPAMADQTGQTKFSNLYDNASTVFEGIGAASSFINSITTGVSGIMNAVSAMKMVPSQISANEAVAGLHGAQANEIKELLGGKKKSLDLSNVSQGIQNTSAILEQLAGFSQLISPDTADFAPILSSLGVPQENIAPYTDVIKQMHANPKMRDMYAKASTSAKFSEAENDKYTQSVVSGMVDLQYKMEYEALDLQYHRNHLANSISALLDTEDFAADSAQLELAQISLGNQSTTVQSAEMALRFKEVETDTAAFLEKLQQRADVIQSIRVAREHIYDLAKGRSLTIEETAMVNRLNAEEMAMNSLASGEFSQIKTTFLRTGQALYDRYRRLDGKGNLKALSGQEPFNFYSDITFNDLIHHTKSPGEIANMWTNTAIQAIGVGAQMYTGYKIGTIGNKNVATYQWNPNSQQYDVTGGTFTSKDAPNLNKPKPQSPIGFNY